MVGDNLAVALCRIADEDPNGMFADIALKALGADGVTTGRCEQCDKLWPTMDMILLRGGEGLLCPRGEGCQS